MLRLITFIVFYFTVTVFAQAEAFRPAIVFDAEKIENAGFNREAYNGALAFQQLHGVAVRFMTLSHQESHEQALFDVIEQAITEHANLIVAVGFAFREPILKAAKRYPQLKLVLLDTAVNAANVQSYVFREEEGAFLVGALAAMASQTGTIGFVGGMDIPIIRKFGCGYAHGARFIAPKIRILNTMNGNNVDAFHNQTSAALLAETQINQGADIVFHAAGEAGEGVIAAAKKRDVLAIGVDFNQNGVAPGHVLTSMLKRIDVAAYLALRNARNGLWRPGTFELGLRENAIGWSLDQHNVLLVKEAWHARLVDLQFSILSKDISVARYSEKAGCPYLSFPEAH